MTIKLISLLGRLDLKTGLLTNLTNGGEGTSGIISTPWTDERKKKQSDRVSGKNNPCFGRNQTGENSPSFGMEMSLDFRLKVSKRNSGENNYFYGSNQSGELNSMFGKKQTDDTKRKMRESIRDRYRSVIIYGVEYSTIKKAVKTLNMKFQMIRKNIYRNIEGFNFIDELTEEI